jgi:hypothetical protein
MKQLQRVIARCSVLGTLLWLTACESEDFLKVESVRSPLMEDFESYASIQEVTAKLPKDLEVKVVADTSLAKNNSQPPYKIHSISVSPYEHLKHLGTLQLTFYNDRLMQSAFYPEKFKSYVSAVEPTGWVLQLGAETGRGNTVIWQGKDDDQYRFVGWADKRLRQQQQRWLVRYN